MPFDPDPVTLPDLVELDPDPDPHDNRDEPVGITPNANTRPVRHTERCGDCRVTAVYRPKTGRVEVTAKAGPYRVGDFGTEFDAAEWPSHKYDAHRFLVERLRVFHGDPEGVSERLRLADAAQRAVVGALRKAGLEVQELEYEGLGCGEANRAHPDLGFRAYTWEPLPSGAPPEYPGYPGGRTLSREDVELFSDLILAELAAGLCTGREAVELIRRLHEAHERGVCAKRTRLCRARAVAV
jgi:hypothetical protein